MKPWVKDATITSVIMVVGMLTAFGIGYDAGKQVGERRAADAFQDDRDQQIVQYALTVDALAQSVQAAEACQTVDVTANLTADKYVEYINGTWECEMDAIGTCSVDIEFDSMARFVCGVGWKQASDEWSHWQREAECCSHKLDQAVGKIMSKHERPSWGCW